MSNPRLTRTYDCGVTREWLYNGHMAVFTLPNSNRATLDSWGEATLNMIDDWQPGRTYLVLHDISARGIALTPHARYWAKRLAQACHKVNGYCAIVLPKSPVAQFVQVFVDYQLNRESPTLKMKTFFSREEAVAWLADKMDSRFSQVG